MIYSFLIYFIFRFKFKMSVKCTFLQRWGWGLALPLHHTYISTDHSDLFGGPAPGDEIINKLEEKKNLCVVPPYTS